MNVPFVDLKAQYQSLKVEMRPAMDAVLDNTAYIGGPALAAFEKDFAAYTGARHAVGCGNGTDALFLALKALDIGPGDEVILPVNTFIATAEAVRSTGADVKFVDMLPATYLIDPDKIEAAVTDKTRAVIPVHLYGQPADMDPILALAGKCGLKVIGDACQAHGALYKGKKIGGMGDLVCYSFYPGKNLGAYGDGGAVVTDDESLAKKLKMLCDHGSAVKYVHELEGYNSRLDGLQAAVLGVKLKHLEDWNEARRRNARLFTELLTPVEGVTVPVEADDAVPVYHLYVIQVDDREGLQKHLQENGVASGIHYPVPLHLQKAYEKLGCRAGDYPVAEKAADRIVSLPMFPELTEEMIRFTVETIKTFLA